MPAFTSTAYSRTRRIRHMVCGAAAATLLTAGLGATGAHAATSPPLPAHALTLDGVHLSIDSPDYPTGAPYVTTPGGEVQVASLSDNKPFRYLSVTAAPYGQKLPESVFPMSQAGHAPAWRAALGAAAKPGPTATIFGQTVAGQITTSNGDLAANGTVTTIETIHWIVEQGGRTWVVTLQHDAANLPAGFGTKLKLSATNPDSTTTVNLNAPTTPAATPRTLTANTVPLGGNLGRPSWWSSNCDGFKSLLNTKFMGLQVCGYTSGSDDVLESNIPGVSQYEWECAELSDRYLVQRYGISGAGGNGNQVADNAYNANKSMFQLYANGSHNYPVAGDVISFAVGGGSFGHTGVVTGSSVDSFGNGTIDMVHQNWNEDGKADGIWTGILVRNWNVQEVTGQGGTVHWLHNPADTGGSSGGASAGPALGDKSTIQAPDKTMYTFTRDAVTGHLQATYVPNGGSWKTTDMSNMVGTPSSAGGAPSAFVNTIDGSIGVITTDFTNGHVQMTYLSKGATSWTTVDLTAAYGTPVSGGGVNTLIAPDGTLYVFSVGSTDGGHLTATYLHNGVWQRADMTTMAGVPDVGTGVPATFVQNNGSIGVITADAANGHSQMTYLSNGASSWASIDLAIGYGTPATDGYASTVIGPDGTLYVFTRGTTDGGHITITYQNTSGVWGRADVTSMVGTPVSAGELSAFRQLDGTIGVIAADGVNGHLRLIYDPSGGSWATADLNSSLFAGTPVTGGNVGTAIAPDGSLYVWSIDSAGNNGHVQATYDKGTTGVWGTADMTTMAGVNTPTAG